MALIKNDMHVNGERLWQNIHETAEFGKVQSTGLTRLCFDDHDKHVRHWFENTCRSLGGTVRIDHIGNQYARFFSSSDNQPALLVGSHLDTQPNGGRFDGILGVLGGIETIRALQDSNYKPKHAIEVINWTNEEGARFAPPMMGSSVACGNLDLETALSATDNHGISVKEASENARSTANIFKEINAKSYLELHIEQGPVLEHEKIDIGIVSAITGITWFEVEFIGQPSHAGTTPLSYRQDSLVAASQFIVQLQHHLHAQKDKLIATVGNIENWPNSTNTVPGKTTLKVDVRSPDKNQFRNIQKEIESLVSNTAKDCAVHYHIQCLSSIFPTSFDPRIIQCIENAAKKTGLSARPMVSGAGHDALQLARLVPTSMIFSPCEHGISHNVAENMTTNDAVKGVIALTASLIEIDQDF